MDLYQKLTKQIKKRLYNKPNHPIHIIKKMIFERFPKFQHFDCLDAHVTTEENFDQLFVPKEHSSRLSAYTVDDKRILRTHTSAHQLSMLANGNTKFLLSGDVYRKDNISRLHHNVFHQLEGVWLGKEAERNLHATVGELLSVFLSGCEIRKQVANFHYAMKCYEYEVKFNGKWTELLGCGLIHPKLIKDAGLDGEEGWSFGIGLDRLAMMVFDIPDIRLFWSEDDRFSSQFQDGKITKFVPFVEQKAHERYVSLWIPEDFNYAFFCDTVRKVCDEQLEEVTVMLIESYAGTRMVTYKFVYRSADGDTTEGQVNDLHERLKAVLYSIYRERSC